MTHFDGVSCDCSIVCFIDLRLLADNVAQLSPARGSDPPSSLWLQSLQCSLRWMAGRSN